MTDGNRAGGRGGAHDASIVTTTSSPEQEAVDRLRAKVAKLRAHLESAEESLAEAEATLKGAG